MTLYVYRLRSGSFASETWDAGLSQSTIEAECRRMNEEDPLSPDPWEAEVIHVPLTEGRRKALLAALGGEFRGV